MSEFVYILTNPTIPDLVQIGRTTNLKQRLKTLASHEGVPVPFECYYCCEVKKGKDIAKRLHVGLDDHRINPKREFFKINPEKVKILLEGWAIQDVTPNADFVDSKDEQESLNRERTRLPNFTFSMVDIPIGSEIAFLEDKTLVATVISDREIEFEGIKTSLSQVTKDIFNNRRGRNWAAYRGPNYWVFDEETLTDRRLRLES